MPFSFFSVPPYAAQNLVELDKHLVHLLDRLEPLRLGDPELLLQVFDRLLLVGLAVVEPGKARDEVLDVLLLDDEVARKLKLTGLELFGRDRLDFLRLVGFEVGDLVAGSERLEVVVPLDIEVCRDELVSELVWLAQKSVSRCLGYSC